MKGKLEIRKAKLKRTRKVEIAKLSFFVVRNSGLLWISDFGLRVLLCGLLLLVCGHSSFAQRRNQDVSPPLSPAEGAREAKALIAEMLTEKPEQNSTNTGLIKIRDSEGNQREVPLKIITVVTRSNWLQIYEAFPKDGTTSASLTIVHTPGGTNQYLLSSPASSAAKLLKPEELTAPFAGSDFWIIDLGYEFLHWPRQAVTKNDMRHSRACRVLESTNPNPSPGAYSRVVCWITVEKPHAPVHADAYDASGAKFKQFDPKNLEKVNGVYQVESVEMRNSKTGSHTILEFDRGE